MTAYRTLRFDDPVREIMRRLPEETIDCLLEAFRQIRSGRLELNPPNSLFRTTQACDYLIAVSVVPQDQVAEVVGLHFLLGDG